MLSLPTFSRYLANWFLVSNLKKEEILAVHKAAIPSNTKKTSNFGLAVFLKAVLLGL